MIALLGLGTVLAADLGGTFTADPLAPTLDGIFFATDTSALPAPYEGRLSGVLAYHPLVAYTADGVTPVVGASATLHASAAWRLGPAQVGLRLPAVLILDAVGLDRPRATAGDPEIQVKLSPWADARLGLAALARVSVPLGGEALWAGAGSPTAAGELILDARQGPWTLGLNLGAAVQEPELLTLDGLSEGPRLGGQLTWRAGLGRCGETRCLTAELVGATGLADLGEDQSSPLEALGAWRQTRPAGRSWWAGGAIGVLPGVGAPAARVFLGVGDAGQGG